MAKKTRRVKKRKQPVRLSAAQMVQPGAAEMSQPFSGTAQVQSAPEAANLEEEYHYVIADLKRIGIIAVGMLAALIVVAFLLT
jgi:hypothetical protein